MTIIEINARAKKVEWGDAVTIPEQLRLLHLAGRVLMIFSMNKDTGLEHVYDSVPANHDLDEAWFTKYLSKGFVIRPHLLNKTVVYQNIIRSTMFGPVFGTVYAKSRRDLDQSILDMGDSVIERFVPIFWKGIPNNVVFN